MAGNQPRWLRETKTQLARSPGKAAVLGALSLVLVIVVVVQLLRLPASASASPASSAPATAKPRPAQPRVAVPSATAPAGETADLEAQLSRRPRPPWPRSARRDPFGLNWRDYFPPTLAVEEEPLSLEDEAKQQPGAEYVLEATLSQPGHPGERVAVINGQTVQKGEQLGEFTVEEIAARHVVLASPQHRVVLQMP